MNPEHTDPLVAEQQALRAQLQAQRRLIAVQLAPVVATVRRPKSVTMRLIQQRPELLLRLLGWLLGAGLVTRAGYLDGLLRMLRSLLPPRQTALPPPKR